MLRTLAAVILTLYMQFITIAAVPQVITGPYRAVTIAGGGCTSLPFSDNTTRANGSLGAPWTSPSSAVTIVSNTASPVAFGSGNQIAYLSGCSALFTSSQFLKFVLVADGDPTLSTFGIQLSVADSSDYYYVYCIIGTGNCNAFSYIAGSSTYLGTFSSTVAIGDTVCAELDSGGTIKLRINSTYGGSFGTSGVSLGPPGLFFFTQGSSPAQVSQIVAGNGTC